MHVAEERLQEALDAFDFGASVAEALRFGKGHIRDTFEVRTQPGVRFILQRISSAAFKRPDRLMENIIGVTEYLGRQIERNGGDREREALRVLRPRSGEKAYFTDSDGEAWRVYPFVEGTVCCQSAETPELFAACGRAFGRFLRLLDGYSVETLHETIPNFHNTEDRLAKLRAAIVAEPLGRVKDCGAEIEYLPWGAKLMTLECGIHFLTDYIEGDRYFHDIRRERQNLDRCRVQFKLVSDIEACWAEMEAIVRQYFK